MSRKALSGILWVKKFKPSKLLTALETFIVGPVSLCTLNFCYLSIVTEYTGASLFLTTMTTAAWAAYGVSASYYYSKAASGESCGSH